MKTLRTIALVTVRIAAFFAGFWALIPLEEREPLRAMLAVACFVAFGAIRDREIDASGRDE